MAKQFGKNAAVDFAAANLMSFGKSFSRLNGQPLDKSEIWYNKAALEAYALTDAAFVGQKVVYVDVDNNKVYHYGIELDGTLKEIGTSPVGDEKTIVVAEDGTVSLAGIAGLAFAEDGEDGEQVQITYQPLLTDAGLTWVRPSATTVEGLAAEIEGLKTNTYTKTQTDAAIAKAVSEAEHLKRSVVAELPAVDKADAHTIYMVKDTNVADGDAYNEYMLIDGALVQIGDTKTDLTNYKQWVDSEQPGEEGPSEQLRAKEFVVLDENGKLTNGGFTVGLMIDAIGAKADAPTDGSRFITAAESTLLGTLENGAEKNVIAGANEDEFTISEGRILEVKEIAEGKVAGLTEKLQGMQNAIDGKVEAEDGKGLSANDFTDALLIKLNGIDAGAQVNVLEEVLINGTKLEISDKKVNIPVATAAALGVVKSSAAENGVTVNADGTMTVNTISASKLVQEENEVLVLDGGSAGAKATAE